MPQITLQFAEYRALALDSVEFCHPLLEQVRISARGKGLSEILCPFTFQWSPAVRALSVLLLWTKANYVLRSNWPAGKLPALSGAGGSYAAALDSALSKKPLWLLDMFGIDSRGNALARSVFVRWNPERKRGGDVTVAVNPGQLTAAGIRIKLNQEPMEDPESCLSLAASIEQSELHPVPRLRETSSLENAA